jgi:hypothetical protein
MVRKVLVQIEEERTIVYLNTEFSIQKRHSVLRIRTTVVLASEINS